MNRPILIAASCCLVGALSARTVPRQTIELDDLKATGATSERYIPHQPYSTVQIKGNPVHVVVPSKQVTLEVTSVDALIDEKAGRLQSAVLTGGVHGTVARAVSGNAHKATFNCDSATITDRPSAGADAFDLETSATLKLTDGTQVGQTFDLSGGHALMRFAKNSAGQQSLQSIDLAGPVVFHANGLLVDKKKGTTGSIEGHGARLTMRRANEDYVFLLSGGAEVSGVAGQRNAKLTGPSFKVVLDAAGNLKEVSSNEQVASGTANL